MSKSLNILTTVGNIRQIIGKSDITLGSIFQLKMKYPSTDHGLGAFNKR